MGSPLRTEWPTGPVSWSHLISEHDWSLYRAALTALQARGLPFAVGGGLAFSVYARRWRHTKDLDLYIRPADRVMLIEVLTEVGFTDYYEQVAYERHWIYRGFRDGVIVDLIWQMANYRIQVEDTWLTRGREVTLRDRVVRLLPPEELLWNKLYVLQRERCDWPDLLNILYAVGPELDWEHLLECLGEDAPVLGGLLSLFGWLCPEQARELPSWIWGQVGVSEPKPGPRCADDRQRVALLDRRDWFGPKTT